MKNGLLKKMISLLICLTLVLSYVPASMLLRAEAAGAESGIVSTEAVADPSTIHAWRDTAFNPTNLSTEHAGGVWTDKSVLLGNADISAAFPGVSGLSVENNNFLVSLSTLGANSMIVGEGKIPTDTIFVLDVSNSMENTDLSAMVSATNDAIHSLLTANEDSRIGVVVYSTDVYTLLPLDRYTPVQKGANTPSTTDDETAYIEMANYYTQIRTARSGSGYNTTYVKNSSGQNVTTSISASGATFIQGGLYQAYQMFNNATVSDNRTPVLVLMSDGAPSYGTTNYTAPSNRNVGNGTTNSITDGLAFLTQLTAAYVKEKITAKYNTNAYLYTVGLGVSEDGQNVSIAESVLDTSKTRSTPESLWTRYLALANTATKTMSFNAAGSNVTVTYDPTVTVNNKAYTDRYFEAEDASDLSGAFQNIVNEINLKAGYNVTRIEGADANTGGYITFVDEIGSGMEVKDIKGILIGNQLHSGEALARAFENGDFGTAGNLTTLGNNMVWALQERLLIEDTQTQSAAQIVMNLVAQAKAAGQLYHSNTGWSNYIGWFGNDDGEFVGFWDAEEENVAIPAGATHANLCYGMLGATTDSQTAHASDMMYVVITISKEIVDGKIAANAPQTVTFRVPASLLPTITYQIEVDAASGEDITESTDATITYIPAEPIRLLYEVGVHSQLTPLNVEDFLRDGYAAKDADGNYYLYTNAWYWEPDSGVADFNNPPTNDNAIGKEVLFDTGKNHISYAYFEPSAQNEHYYYTEDSALYVKNGSSYQKLTTAPVTDGSVTYYFQHKTFVSENAASATNTKVDAQVDIHYGAISQKLLQNPNNIVQGSDGVYYIKEGTMHYQTIHEHDKDKTLNTTGSFKHRMHQLVDIAVVGGAASHHYEITYLGNNGRVTYAPAQGLKLSKVMSDGSTPDASFAFDVALTAPAGQALAASYETIHIAANGTQTAGTATVANGKLSVTLKPAESIYILGLDAGTAYTVTEGKTAGYLLSTAAGDTGVIAENAISEAVFTNAVQQYGSLTVSKWVTYQDGVAPTVDNHEFDVTVTLKDGQENYQGNVTVGTAQTAVVDGKVSFKLKHGQQVIISGIPEGVTYTVAENEATLPAGYSWTNKAAATLSGTIDTDGQAVELVNTYDPDDVVISSTDPAITLTVNKEVIVNLGSNAYLMDEYDFLFKLERYNPATGEWDKISDNNKITISNPADPQSSLYDPEDNKGSVAVDLSGVPFTSVGAHYFRISEDTTSIPTGWTYDRTHHDFKVEITDTNLDGKLEIASVDAVDQTVTVTPIDSDSDSIPDVWAVSAGFVNSYEAKSAKLTIEAKKTFTHTITGENLLKDGQFTFELYEADDDSYDITGKTPVLETNGANGDIVFPTATYHHTGNTNYYYYVLKETDPAGTGITADGNVYQIMVQVDSTTNSNGAAVAAVSAISWYRNGQLVNQIAAPADSVFNAITFANTYTPQANTTVSLPVTKTLTNQTPGAAGSAMPVPANTYQFKLTAITANAPMPANSEVFAGTDGAAAFTGFTFTHAGTYEYAITEVDTGVAGVTYDASSYRAIVTITDNGAGQLESSVVYTNQNVHTDHVVFANTYTAAPAGQVVLSGGKELTVAAGSERALQPGEFFFTLTKPDGTTETVSNTLENGTRFAFSPITFNTVGTYRYTISENVPRGAVNNTLNGITYAAIPLTLDLEVYDDGSGALKVRPVGQGDLNTQGVLNYVAHFENRYKAESAAVTLTAHKDLVGRPLNASDAFKFKLEAIGNAPMPASNIATSDENGNASFGTISYSSVGTYQYRVTELDKDGNALTAGYTHNGVTYSQEQYTVTVTVADTGRGYLVAQVASVDQNGNPQPGGIIFTNTYEAAPVDAAITAKKELFDLTGNTSTQLTVPANTYQFQLEAIDNAPMPTDDKVYAAAGGAVTFDTVTYDEPGVYRYTLTEVNLNKGGIDYDDSVYTVEVTVTDNLQGKLEAAIRYIKDQTSYPEAVFTNSYAADPVSAQITATKTFTDRTPGAAQTDIPVPADTFKFKLTAVGNAPMPVSDEVYAAAGGAITFGEITYTRAGTYQYTLSEIDMQLPGVTTDPTVYEITVTIVDDGNGKLALAGIAYANSSSMVFNNYYTASPVSIHVEGDSTATDGKVFTDETSLPENKKDLDDYAFRFTLAEVGGNVVQTVTDNGKGFRFDALTYDAPGQYQYLIYEHPGNQTGITYDSSKYLVTVTVTDNGSGQLQADVKYEKAPSGESDDYTDVAGVVFQNSYAAKKTAVIFSGSKTLTGIRELKENDFSFQLKDATSGTVLATAKNNAKGIFTFDAIVYTAEGTYTYQLVEKDEGAKGITYDTTVYTLTVTVKDVDGQLQCTTVIKNGNEIAQAAGFTNVFTPDVAVATVSVQKELVNKTGKKIGLDGFTFQLEGNGQKQTFTTDTDGKAELPLTFTAADAGKTYTYKLSEVAGSTKYMTYDSTVYEITVAITKGEDGQLQVAVQRDGAGAFRFVNTYNGAPPSTTPDTGDSTNVGLLITLALSSLACLVVLILSRKRTES